MTLLQTVFLPLAMLLVAFGIYRLFVRVGREAFVAEAAGNATRGVMSAVMLLCTAALIIPIRGGFSTAVNHTGNVYYSTNVRLNHAAVNPCSVSSNLSCIQRR